MMIYFISGDDLVPVAECSKEEYGSHPKLEMNMRDYLHILHSDNPTKSLYLKDCHFIR